MYLPSKTSVYLRDNRDTARSFSQAAYHDVGVHVMLIVTNIEVMVASDGGAQVPCDGPGKITIFSIPSLSRRLSLSLSPFPAPLTIP
jgi:hypothetical protein